MDKIRRMLDRYIETRFLSDREVLRIAEQELLLNVTRGEIHEKSEQQCK